jgi:hypothetical protein
MQQEYAYEFIWTKKKFVQKFVSYTSCWPRAIYCTIISSLGFRFCDGTMQQQKNVLDHTLVTEIICRFRFYNSDLVLVS